MDKAKPVFSVNIDFSTIEPGNNRIVVTCKDAQERWVFTEDLKTSRVEMFLPGREVPLRRLDYPVTLEGSVCARHRFHQATQVDPAVCMTSIVCPVLEVINGERERTELPLTDMISIIRKTEGIDSSSTPH